MRKSRPMLTRIYAPRALAVLSFALALLAAQPMARADLPTRSRSIVLKDTTAPAPAMPRLIPASSAAIKNPQSASNEISPTRRLHILATVEILQRLLIAELHLRPVDHSFTVVFFAEPVCQAIIAPATAAPAAISSVSPLLLPCERSFAIEHCLLPPPLV